MRKTLENLLNRVAKEMDCPQMDEVAAFLLANGVIVPPCKVGSTFYVIEVNNDSCDDCYNYFPPYEYGDIAECEHEAKYPLCPSVEDYLKHKCCPKHTLEIAEHKFSISHYEWVTRELGKTVFLTKAEAEKALAERSRE